VYGPSGEITIYAREREEPAPALDAGAAAPPAPVALSAPVAGGAGRDGGFPSKVNAAAAVQAPAVLSITSPSLPSQERTLAELRANAVAGLISIGTLVGVPVSVDRVAAVVIVTSGSGALSVFSFAEVSSPGGPSLDVSGAAPRLVAPFGRGLEDVVSIELRILAR
jgi:hypothetical protein